MSEWEICVNRQRFPRSRFVLMYHVGAWLQVFDFILQVQRVGWHLALDYCRFLARLHIDPFFVLVYILVFIRWYRTLAAYIQNIFTDTQDSTHHGALCVHLYTVCVLVCQQRSGCFENGERRATLRLANFSLLLFTVFFLYRFLLISLEGENEEESIEHLSSCKNFFL